VVPRTSAHMLSKHQLRAGALHVQFKCGLTIEELVTIMMISTTFYMSAADLEHDSGWC
jgi:hypothetical protein